MRDSTAAKHLNLNVRGLGNSATVAINDRSNALRREGRRVFKLGLGQSPFPVPGSVVQSLRDHAHEKDYLPTHGLEALRGSVARHTHRAVGVERGASDVLIGPGSKELMFILQLSFYGDLIIPAPSWVSYGPQASIIGRKVRHIATTEASGWRLTPEGLSEVCAQDPGRPRLLILNYPNNPTGLSYSDEELKALAAVARQEGILLLSDEIYGELNHRGAHTSIARHYPEGTIISSGLSKWCGAGGWRLGTFVFPPELGWLREAMTAVASETFTSTAAPIQYAAITAFDGNAEIDEYLLRSRRVLRAMGGWIAARLRSADIACSDPEGGFYHLPSFEAHREKLAARGITDAPTLCERLLQETGVAILPGDAFGRPAGELTARLAYVDFDGAAALEGAGREHLDEAWLRAHCGDVLEAIDCVCQWVS
jgi:aspartate aminotransferase